LAVAASVSSSADTILAAMRAGASEFLVPPFEVAHLKNTLEKQKKAITVATAGPVVNGRLMCFLPAQGGNGASTLATHLAAAITGIIHKQVLLIDYDFHCGTVAFRLRLKPDFSFADAVERIADIDELWERLTSKSGGVDVLSAPPTGMIIPGEAFRRVAAIFTSARRTYPYVLVDFPSALHASCRDVLGLANSVYLISTPEVVSLHLARRRVNELINLGLSSNDIHLILNRVGSKKTLNVDDVAEVVGIPVFSSLPNDYGAVSDASLKGGLIPNDTRLGRQITDLAVRIVGADAPAEKKVQQDKGGKKWKGFLNFSS
jgi:pilus assembly protein CpaE